MFQPYLILFFVLSIKEASSLAPFTSEIGRRLLHYSISSIYDGLEPKKFALQITDELHTNEFNCPKPTGNFPDEHNCECFYLCSDKRVSHLQCFPGYAFDSSLGYCCPKKNVSTCYNSLKEENSMKKSSTNKKNEDESFHCLSDGAYSDPKNCTKYYICVENKPIEFNCPDQTKFDKFSKVCLPEKQAICLDSQKNTDQDQKLHSVPKSPQIELQANEILETGSEDISTHHLFVAYL